MTISGGQPSENIQKQTTGLSIIGYKQGEKVKRKN